ncbi:hypothetical protein D3C71_1818740 [compost metagenome]
MALLVEHAGDFIQREASGAAECDQRQALHDAGVVDAAQAIATQRADQPAFFVVAQSGGGQAGLAADLADIEFQHVDLKSTLTCRLDENRIPARCEDQ